MNLLLLTAAEAATNPVVLDDARADHVRKVLRAEPGDPIRVGVLDGPLGRGEIRQLTPELHLDCTFEECPPERGEDVLLLAVPRPIVLQRCLTHATALGFGRILLFRTWRVDKNHLSSRVLTPESIRTQLLDGLSQSRRTHIPEVKLFPRFRPLVEDQLESLLPPGPRFVADPNAADELASVATPTATGLSLAIGPERGFNDHELETFASAGFAAVRTGSHPLRVESALSYVTGQLHALRRRGLAPE